MTAFCLNISQFSIVLKLLKRLGILVFFLSEVATGSTTVKLSGGIPWQSNKRYRSISRYEMRMDSVAIHVELKRGIHWYTTNSDGNWWRRHIGWNPDGVVENLDSTCSGKYVCSLEYQTFGCQMPGRQSGTAFRTFDKPTIAFIPLNDADMIFTKNRGVWRKFWKLDPEEIRVPVGDARDTIEDSDFPFREVYQVEGKHLDCDGLYCIGWNQKADSAASLTHLLNIFWSQSRNLPQCANENTYRARIRTGSAEGWSECPKDDLANVVIQSEAKLMTYALYGQADSRKEGDIWAVPSDMLTSFLPQLPPDRQPFKFGEGQIVLKAGPVSKDGIQRLEMVTSGVSNGRSISTNLQIEPNVDSDTERPSKFQNPDYQDVRNNFLRFEIDTDNKICKKAECRVTLRDYSGPIPKTGQLELKGKTIEGDQINSFIKNGTIVLAAEVTTTVTDN